MLFYYHRSDAIGLQLKAGCTARHHACIGSNMCNITECHTHLWAVFSWPQSKLHLAALPAIGRSTSWCDLKIECPVWLQLKLLGTSASYPDIQRWRGQEAFLLAGLLICGASTAVYLLLLLAGQLSAESLCPAALSRCAASLLAARASFGPSGGWRLVQVASLSLP